MRIVTSSAPGLLSRLWLCLVLVAVQLPVMADGAHLLVVSESTSIGDAILAELSAALDVGTAPPRISVVRPDAIAGQFAENQTSPDLVLSIGSRAAREIDEYIDEYTVRVPVLHIAITAALGRRLAASTHGDAPHTTLVLDQPPDRQMQALQRALPQLRRIGVLTGSAGSTEIVELRRAAAAASLDIEVAEVPEPRLLLTRLTGLLRTSDLLLVTPDTTIYNQFTLRNVLLAAYRQRKPVIGISQAYVDAGALLAVHATPLTIGTEAADLTREILAGKILPAERSPDRFVVTINRQVARSLDIDTNLPDATELERTLRALEATR